MNKRKLISQNEELYNLVRETELKNESLKKRIDELSIMLGAKDFEISELKNELIEIKALKPKEPKLYSINNDEGENIELDIVPEEPTVEETIEESLKVKEESIKTTEEVKETNDEKTIDIAPTYINNNDLKNEIEKYAAKAISNISLKTAMLSNLFADSKSENAKDLLTLTLGRAEIFKQKVFEASKNSINFDNAKASINLLEAEVLEYFEGLKAQLK